MMTCCLLYNAFPRYIAEPPSSDGDQDWEDIGPVHTTANAPSPHIRGGTVCPKYPDSIRSRQSFKPLTFRLYSV